MLKDKDINRKRFDKMLYAYKLFMAEKDFHDVQKEAHMAFLNMEIDKAEFDRRVAQAREEIVAPVEEEKPDRSDSSSEEDVSETEEEKQEREELEKAKAEMKQKRAEEAEAKKQDWEKVAEGRSIGPFQDKALKATKEGDSLNDADDPDADPNTLWPRPQFALMFDEADSRAYRLLGFPYQNMFASKETRIAKDTLSSTKKPKMKHGRRQHISVTTPFHMPGLGRGLAVRDGQFADASERQKLGLVWRLRKNIAVIGFQIGRVLAPFKKADKKGDLAGAGGGSGGMIERLFPIAAGPTPPPRPTRPRFLTHTGDTITVGWQEEAFTGATPSHYEVEWCGYDRGNSAWHRVDRRYPDGTDPGAVPEARRRDNGGESDGDFNADASDSEEDLESDQEPESSTEDESSDDGQGGKVAVAATGEGEGEGDFKYKCLHSRSKDRAKLIDRKFLAYLHSKTSRYLIALQTSCRSKASEGGAKLQVVEP